jgi:hypothetical protein
MNIDHDDGLIRICQKSKSTGTWNGHTFRVPVGLERLNVNV